MPDDNFFLDNFAEILEALCDSFGRHFGNDREINEESHYWQPMNDAIGVNEAKPVLSLHQVMSIRLIHQRMGNYNDRIFDKEQALGTLQSLEFHLRSALDCYNSLPSIMKQDVEKECCNRMLVEFPRIMSFPYKMHDKSKTTAVEFIALSYEMPLFRLLAISESLLGEMKWLNAKKAKPSGIGGIDTRPILDQLKTKKYPHRETINEQRSYNRVIKVVIIDELRKIWQECKKEEAPKSIQDQGSEFGDFAQEVFDILKINANVRRAMDAWREELKHGSM